MSGRAQELFNFTEPASNMPARSLGLRLNNWVMDDRYEGGTNYHFIPEAMWGANKHLMLHLEGFFANDGSNLRFEGGGVYAKYRFYSNDKVYRHLRIAAFGRASTNNGLIHAEEIETNGFNSGFETGMIFTQLLHKLALSSTISFEHATNNRNGNELPSVFDPNAINYSLSAGRLICPKHYVNYRQTNLNLMLEFLGQSLAGSDKRYLDMAPSVQLIFNSQTRVDIGYKLELYANMHRAAPNGVLIRVEHLFFNVLNKKNT